MLPSECMSESCIDWEISENEMIYHWVCEHARRVAYASIVLGKDACACYRDDFRR